MLMENQVQNIICKGLITLCYVEAIYELALLVVGKGLGREGH